MTSSLPEMLRARAEATPHALAFVRLEDGEREGASLTFSELHQRASSIAVKLRSGGFQRERALLVFPQSLEFIEAFFGCLYAGVVAIPVPAPEPGRLARALPRLKGVVEDARPKLCLTTEEMRAAAVSLLEEQPTLAAMEWMSVDAGDAPETVGEYARPAGDDLAYLQYTSGSTSTPKGVLMSHENIFANMRIITEAYGGAEGDAMVTWLPQFHDLGLVFGVLWPIQRGFTTYVMTPMEFVARPMRWLEAISRYGARISGGANFAYDLCVRKSTPAQRAALDLRKWEIALNGAEPVRWTSLREFAEAFEGAGFSMRRFSPSYGLAEATLFLTTVRPETEVRVFNADAAELERGRITEAAAGRPIVGCGIAYGDTAIRIVEPDTGSVLGDRALGEVWAGGASVSAGYLNNEEATRETFHNFTADGEGPFLRTGDLGFMDQDEIFIAGRTKDLLIIRGSNHYPQDIEETVSRCHSALRPGGAAAFPVVEDEEDHLVVVQEVQESLTDAPQERLREVVRAMRRAVAEEHELQLYAAVLIRPRTLPKTTSGKIARRPCKEQFESRRLAVVYEERATDGRSPGSCEEADALLDSLPADQQELHASETIRAAVSRLLSVPQDEIRADTSFFELGLDSLKAAELSGRLQRRLGRSVSTRMVLEAPTVSALAAVIVAPETAVPVSLGSEAEIEEMEEGSL